MMRYHNFIIRHFQLLLFFVAAFALTGCDKFLDNGAPPTRIGVAEAFQTESAATSAVIGLYSGSPVSGLTMSFSGLCGASADDVRYTVGNPEYGQFEQNAIQISNSLNNNSLWAASYTQLYQANAIIENLAIATSLSDAVKNQLMGEAKTWRAFIYFYLVNLYGSVPLVTTTDVAVSANMPRTAASAVWSQITSDLEEAVNLLSSNYPSADRARINKYAAATLLAKAYLYQQNWAKAEQMTEMVLSSGTYTLVQDLDAAFKTNSNEIIWQMATPTGVSTFGANYAAPPDVLPGLILYDTLYASFEDGDLRKQHWAKEITIGGIPYHLVNKYKIASGTGDEFNVVFRLAEVWLINAEAKAKQGKVGEAISGLNQVRNRADLEDLDENITEENLALAIEQERYVELFGEWGNRWLDLKRTPSVSGPTGETRADQVLSAIKTAWKAEAKLYPIPAQQIVSNPELTQNEGY